MKKSIIALTVMSFAAIILFSCAENEVDVQVTNLEKGDLAFSLSGTQTRSEAIAMDEEENLITLETEDGSEVIFEETVVDLNSPAGLLTRGTPVYSENVTSLTDYQAFNAIIYNSAGTKKYDLAPFKYDGQKLYIRHFYVADPFDGCDPMSLYMWMPTDMTSKGVTFGNSAYGKNSSDSLTITFTYAGGESVGTAAEQEDILFSARKLKAAEYDQAIASTTGAPSVLFFHALTGVKFALANPSTDNIIIEEITFKNLQDNGTCVVTPVSETKYTDNTSTYSSGLSTVVNWTPGTTPVSEYSKDPGYTQTYTKDDVQDWSSKPSDSKFPDDFYGDKNGGKQNLNTSNAEYTFWLMPQTISKDVTVTIKYKVGNDGTTQTWVLNYGAALVGKQWKAGELRTYTIKIDEVNVMIEDKVNPSEATNVGLVDKNGNPVLGPDGKQLTYTKYAGTKTDVKIKNTGNTDAFIRASLIGQWLDMESGDPVFGYTDFTSGNIEIVDSWYQDQFVSTEAGAQGTFVGLPGYKGASATINNWTKGNDGYYYYTAKVPKDTYVPNNLFTSYTVLNAPVVAVSGEVKNVYFRLEIATQAISAKKIDGTDYSWAKAWENALGYDPSTTSGS